MRLAEEPQERIDPLTQTTVLEIRWHDEDALPFPLCLHEFAGRRSRRRSRAAMWRSPTTDRRLCPQPPVTI